MSNMHNPSPTKRLGLPSNQQWYINQLFGLNVWNQLYAPIQLQRNIQFDNGKRKSALEYYPDGKLSYAETSGEKGSTIKVYFPNGKEKKTVIVNKSATSPGRHFKRQPKTIFCSLF